MVPTLFMAVIATILTLAASMCAQEAGDACLESKCCMDPAMKCFRKNQYWAACKYTCDSEKIDPKDGSKWSCQEVQAGVNERCSLNGQECTTSTCCQDEAYKCFEKNQYFATCSIDCPPIGAKDPASAWSCKVKQDKCTLAGDDCSATGCCQRGDMQCFRKNEFWASCKKECDPNIPDADDGTTWKCDLITEADVKQTPAPTPAPSTTLKPTFILDNSGLKRPIYYGP